MNKHRNVIDSWVKAANYMSSDSQFDGEDKIKTDFESLNHTFEFNKNIMSLAPGEYIIRVAVTDVEEGLVVGNSQGLRSDSAFCIYDLEDFTRAQVQNFFSGVFIIRELRYHMSLIRGVCGGMVQRLYAAPNKTIHVIKLTIIIGDDGRIESYDINWTKPIIMRGVKLEPPHDTKSVFDIEDSDFQ